MLRIETVEVRSGTVSLTQKWLRIKGFPFATTTMSKASQPELKKFMDKKLFVHVQGGRKVSGTLRGYDLFLNLVIDDAQEETTPAQRHPIGTVVIRGNSVTSMETLEGMS